MSSNQHVQLFTVTSNAYSKPERTVNDRLAFYVGKVRLEFENWTFTRQLPIISLELMTREMNMYKQKLLDESKRGKTNLETNIKKPCDKNKHFKNK